MPLSLDKVHTFKVIDGVERLAGTNLYKRFEHATIEYDGEGKRIYTNTECYIAQGGHWYDGGGADVATDALPGWLWEACKAMDPADRMMYRIILPEEVGAGKNVPTIEEAGEWPTRRMIMEALISLDPHNDDHWTREGLPSLVSLRDILKVKVARSKLDIVAPHFVRPGS